MPTTLGLRDLNRATLVRQMLCERTTIDAPAAIARLVGMQAQLPKPPFIGLWTRLAGFERQDLVAALLRKEVVRATSLRGTIHLMTAEDFLATRAILAPMLERNMRAILKDRLLGVDLERLVRDASRTFVAPRTFDAFRDGLTTEAASDVRALAHAVRCLVPLVQVPSELPWAFPASADFMLARAWLDNPAHDSSVDVRALTVRYLEAFGPATPGDMQTWSGLQGLRATFEDLRPSLEVFRDERRRELFDLPSAPRPGGEIQVPVRFLPEFDNVISGHQDRTRFIADEHKKAVFLPNLRVAATVLVDGFVAGTWKAERKRNAATLTVTPLRKSSRRETQDVETEASLLVRFVESDAESFAVRFASS